MKAKKGLDRKAMAAVFMVNFAYMSDMTIMPAADAIFSDFPDAPMWILNFILTGAQLLAVASALLAPLFMKRHGKKQILVFFFAVFAAASCLGAAVKNVYYVAAMRAVVGFTFGVLEPTALALLTDAYREDEEQCASVVGSFNGVMTGMGAAMTIIAGWLCTRGWRMVYLEYLAAVPMLILMIFAIPSTMPEKPQQIASRKTDGGEFSIRRFLFLMVSVLLSCLTFNTMTYQCSIFVSQTGMGDSLFSGFILCLLAVCSAVSSLGFGVIYKRLRLGVGILSFGLTAAAYVGCCFAANRQGFIISMIILGLAYGLELPLFYMYAGSVAVPSKSPLIMSCIAAGLGFGAFVTSYTVTFLQNLLGITELIKLWPVYVGISIVAAIMYIAASFFDKNG